MRGIGKRERRERVDDALGMIRMSDLGHRMPRELSGGQQQRVALARAMVIRPAVLLLDEPLSNLDAKLRGDMRLEIRQLQQHLGITTILVTHDQEEALTMSDRIVIMNIGRVEQVGEPREVYLKPATEFVARFIGDANNLDGNVVLARDGEVEVAVAGLQLVARSTGTVGMGERAIVRIRPEAISIERAPVGAGNDAVSRVEGVIERVVFVGASTNYLVRLNPALVLRASTQNRGGPDEGLAVGVPVTLSWHQDACQAIPERTK
jgi:ABC-type Fe3+/spermidine/putrescine transport system ATPase subunit